MKTYKKEFIKFLIDNGSLKFGEFTLKSGRISPYFLNTGMLYSGSAVSRLGDFYAETVTDRIKKEHNVIFGPAYKGIPLAVSTVSSLYNKFGIIKDYCFNRKEAKGHGDAKGVLVGKQLNGDDSIVIIDDVITAGTAIRETLEILRTNGSPKVSAVVVSVDRMEKGNGELSAIQELTTSTGIEFFPIVNFSEIMEYLEKEGKVSEDIVQKMHLYREKYGV